MKEKRIAKVVGILLVCLLVVAVFSGVASNESATSGNLTGDATADETVNNTFSNLNKILEINATENQDLMDNVSNDTMPNKNMGWSVVYESDGNNGKDIILHFSFEAPTIEKVTIFNETYDRVIMLGLPNSGNPNEPILPVKPVNVLLPPPGVVESIEVTYENKVTIGKEFNIELGSEPVPINHDSDDLLLPRNSQAGSLPINLEDLSSSYEYDINLSRPHGVPETEKVSRLITNTSSVTATTFNLTTTLSNYTEPFPGKLYTRIGIQKFRGYSILIVNLHPVQYIPETGEIYYFGKMTLTVKTKEEVFISPLLESPMLRGLLKDTDAIQKKVDNPSMVDNYVIPPKILERKSMLVEPSESYEYVIITTQELKNSRGEYTFQDLADYKHRKGLNTAIVTVEEIVSDPAYWDSNPIFNDTQAKIRKFIKDAYLNWGTEYILLGGDADPGNEIVPARYLYVDGEYMPSDLYYACLDGNYNYGEDNRWGEPVDGTGGGDVDLVAEVYVGRACVDSERELSNFVMKTLEYESGFNQYLENVTMVGEYLGFGGVADWGGNYKDEMIDGSYAHGYVTVGIPGDEYNVSTLYDRDWPGNDWPKSELIGIINNGTHIINHLGHGNIGYAMKLYNHDIENLTNDKFLFAYSQTCLAGHFDNVGDDCAAEHFTVETPHGAFAVIMNARYGWGRRGSTDGPSQRYDREFYDAIYNEDLRELGRANQDSKEDNLFRIDESRMRWCYYGLNLFGDPEIGIKSAELPEHDIRVKELSCPDHGVPDETVYINATICNQGKNDETSVLVNFTVNGVLEDNVTINALESQASQDVSFEWTLSSGVYQIEIEAQPVPGEDVTANNIMEQAVIVEPDIAVVNTSISGHILLYEETRINASIKNIGKIDGTDIEVRLNVEGETINTSSIPSLPSGEEANVSLYWTPIVSGARKISIYALPLEGESVVYDNYYNTTVTIRIEPDIWVNRTSINVTVEQGNVVNTALKIGNDGTDILDFSLSIPRVNTSFEEEWEPCATGYDAPPVWTVDGLCHYDQGAGYELTHYWKHFDREVGFPLPHSGDYCAGLWWSNGNGGDTLQDEWLVTPKIDLSGWEDAQLEFYSVYTMKRMWEGNPNQHDYVKISVDGGDWEILGDLHNDDEFDFNGCSGGPGGYGWNWNEIPIVMDLSKYNGHTIQIAWNYYWSQSGSAGIWMIDDVVIRGAGSWLSVFPLNGIVDPSNETNITVAINATQLEAGKHYGFIYISNNDPDENPLVVSVNLTVPLPPHDIKVCNITAPEEIEIYETATINATIKNIGYNDESNIEVRFSVDGVLNDTIYIDLISEEAENVSFYWTPTAIGEYLLSVYAVPVTGENYILNNEDNTTVMAYVEPDIWVNRTSINITLEQGNVVNTALKIGNNGTALLNFDVRFYGSDADVHDVIVGVVNGMSSERDPLITTLSEIGYTYYAINSADDAINNGCNVIIDYPGTNIVSDGAVSLYDYVANGNGYVQVSDWGRDPIPNSWEWISYGTPVTITLEDAIHPITTALPGSWSGFGFWHNAGGDYVGWGTDPSNPNICKVQASGRASHERGVTAQEYGSGRFVYIGFNTYGDDANENDTRLLMNSLNWAATGNARYTIDWLTVTPTSGNISPSTDLSLTATVNATNLEAGSHYGYINIISNDVDENNLVIPINVTVPLPPHDIKVCNITVPEEIEIYETATVNATIKNIGLNAESNIEVQFSVNGVLNDTLYVDLLSEEAENVSFYWTPTAVGEYLLSVYAVPVTGENFILNNEDNTTITAYVEPDIWVNRTSINVSIEQGNVVNASLKIGNNGTDQLKWNGVVGERGIVINEICTLNDWVELYNYYPVNVDIGGWTLYCDEYPIQGGVAYIIPDGFILPAHGFVQIHDGSGTDDEDDLYIGSNVYWNSPPESPSMASLVNDKGTVVDYIEWSADGSPYAGPFPVGEWCGTIIQGAGQDCIYRNHDMDTNDAMDWTLAATSMLTPKVLNPGQSGECGGAGWLIIEPTNGTIDPAMETIVNISINATQLEAGMHNGFINILNNDPDENPITVSVNLTVPLPPHDIKVWNVNAPETIEPSETAVVNATVSNVGSSNEMNIEIQFKVDGSVNDTMYMDLLSDESKDINFSWTPSSAGVYNMSIYAVPVEGEVTFNNYANVTITANNKPILTDEYVTPTTGVYGDTFTYYVNYTDIDNHAPAYVNVVIDGGTHSMQELNASDNNVVDGKWYYYSNCSLAIGLHAYYITCSDGWETDTTTTHYEPKVTPSAEFNNVYTDHGTDTDGDGLYNYLTIDVGVNVTKAGSYRVSGKLYDSIGNSIDSKSNTTLLISGNQSIQLKFEGVKIRQNRVNGLYNLKYMYLYNASTGVQLDYLSYAYTTSYYNYTDFQMPPAEFNEVYSDTGTDIDGDGLYNYLTIDVGVNVTKAGNYRVEGRLDDSYGGYIEWRSNYTYLNIGNQTVKLDFEGIKIRQNEVNGTFDLKNLRLYDSSTGDQLDYIYDAYTTSYYNYTDFQMPPAEFNEVYSDTGTDTDGDGLYNYLTIDVGVNVTKAGSYRVRGYLYDNTGHSIDYKSNTTYLNAGSQTVQLNFEGMKIRQNEVNGPYNLKSLYLYNSSTGVQLDYIYDAYTTSYYNYTDFQIPPAEFNNVYSDYGEDTDGDGLYDYLVVDVGVNVIDAGDYRVRGELYENGTYDSVDYDSNTTYLNEGNQTIQLRFEGIRIRQNEYNGTYDLKYLYLYNVSMPPPPVPTPTPTPVAGGGGGGGGYVPPTIGWIDYKSYAYTTSYYNYTDFQIPPAEFNDVYIDYGEDTDGDGLYNYLVVDVGINVTEAGDYEVSGELYENGTYNYVDYAYNTTCLNEGNQTIQLRFEGIKIRNNEYNGTYDLKYLELYNATYPGPVPTPTPTPALQRESKSKAPESIPVGYGEQLDYRYYAYTTSYYNYSEFEESIPDVYEPDDKSSLANYIFVDGTKQTHNFHVPGDQDWMKFNATEGSSYTIETSELGNESDTYLYLYDTDGTTEIDHDDDSGSGLASKIVWNCSISGTYYVMVRHYSFSAFGPETRYNISVTVKEAIFDTKAPANPYPSIFGTHSGTIKPNQSITVQKLYTYPCAGTGGHTEYAMIWNETIGDCAVAEWNGYVGNCHIISFNKTLTLEEGVIYNYTIRTGSYPQIHHNTSLLTPNGWINCTEFVDANGKKYTNWIPAIRLWA